MTKKIGLVLAGALVLASPLLASAASVADIQAQIQSLLAQVRSLQAQLQQLQQLQQSQGDSAASSTPSLQGITLANAFSSGDAAEPQSDSVPCMFGIARLGNRGDAVKCLQQRLSDDGAYSGPITGFFGPLTLAAVQQFQTRHDIVSSGDAQTTGYGIAGPRTLAFLKHRWRDHSSPPPVITSSGNCGTTYDAGGVASMICGSGGSSSSGSGGSSSETSLAASPLSGAVPLAVLFTGSNLVGASQYIIAYGDGTNSGPLTAPACGSATGCGISASHTYPSAGTYTATLQNYAACMWSTPACMMASQIFGSATITVSAAQ